MKKLLLFALIIGGSVAFTSCGKDECKCDSGTITEDDVEGSGLTLQEACDLAKLVDSSCSM